ncbi:hypothetical protein DI396_15565 [Litorivita pollutaquae]|uniref:Sulfotransferase family protein n=1 Tax=Litorivita pollutaquae TaxID=2200892 RepID=A0A2V4MVH9_9RHOB|nr:hypothetical protein [Litorivita pollutaquae]PYC46414.1 hypothetical protein DI396_15565 [Litorivita pollutaquae]
MSGAGMMPQRIDLSDHPVHSAPPVGAPYVLGRWHKDRVSLKGYLREAQIFAKSRGKTHDPKRFIILGRPRSGTTLLVQLLNQVAGIDCRGEELHYAMCDPSGFLHNMARSRNADVAVYGTKIITYQMFEVQRLRDHHAFLARLADSGFRFIHMRRNTFDQCLSLSVAQQTQTYHLQKGSAAETLDIAVEPAIMEAQLRWNLAMLDYEDQLLAPFAPLTLNYSTAFARPELHQPSIDRICDWLGHARAPVKAALKRTSARTNVTNRAALETLTQDLGMGSALHDG